MAGVDAEYAFRHLGRFQPFVSAGYSFEAIKMDVTSDQDQVRLHGGGPDVGLGFDYFTHNRNSIGLGITERFIHYRKPADPRFREGLDSRSTFVWARWNIYFRRAAVWVEECSKVGKQTLTLLAEI